MKKKITVKVPATTANMGAGFDCIGMALNMYNKLTIEEADHFSIEIFGESGDINDTVTQEVLKSKKNIAYRAISYYYAKIGVHVPTLKLTMDNEILFARGLGSSSAAIVAGFAAANELNNRHFCNDVLIQMATEIEGHPDNVAPALLGGLVITATEFGKVCHTKLPICNDELSFIAFISDIESKTVDARGKLPNSYTKEDVVFNISRAVLFAASMVTKNWDNLRIAVDDKIHQPYRKDADFDSIKDLAYSLGAKAVFLSGAGSTIMAIVLRNHEQNFLKYITPHLDTLEGTWRLRPLHMDKIGVVVE